MQAHLKIYYFCHIIVPLIGSLANVCVMDVAECELFLEYNILKRMEIRAAWGAIGMFVF